MSEKIPISRIVDFVAGHLSREESLALLERIERDEEASRDLDLVASMMDLAGKEGDTLFADRAAGRDSVMSRLRVLVSRTLLPKFRDHPVLSGAAAFAVVFATLMMMLPSASPYGSLASLEDFDFGATVRGVELEDFTVAFNLYQRGDYEQAINTFERHIRAFPRSGYIDYAHYSAGAAYLRWSEWRLPSVFIGFDQDRVRRGVEHLQEVTRNSVNRRLLEDARWLLAKGNLMLLRPDMALDELRMIERMGGNRCGEAGEMVMKLHTRTNGD